jgi:CTP:molybdopterin cytidylyltransferase MocA
MHLAAFKLALGDMPEIDPEVYRSAFSLVGRRGAHSIVWRPPRVAEVETANRSVLLDVDTCENFDQEPFES